VPQAIEAKQFSGFIGRVLAETTEPNAQPALKEWVDAFADETRENYTAERSPGGQPWSRWRFRPLDAPDDHPTLFISGALQASVTQPGSTGNINEVGSDSVTYGTNIPYAASHQYGAQLRTERSLVGRGGRGYIPAGTLVNIPARPFLGVTDSQANQAASMIARHIVSERIGKG